MPEASPSSPLSPFSWRWLPRAESLRPSACVAHGAAAGRLAERLLSLAETPPASQGAAAPGLGRLRGVATVDTLLILGDEADLPWVDGIEYLGVLEAYPGLWWPTRWQPDVPVDWLAAAFCRLHAPPLAILAEPALLLPLAAARPIDREILKAWMNTATNCQGKT